MTHQAPTHCDDVVGVEVTIDGMLVIADRLHLMDFPVALGIRLNIPQVELRDIVWEQVARDLTAQGVLDLFGEPHPEVAAMVDTLSRADRTLEGRWWRRDVGGKMVRFVVCRKGDRHVVAARDGDMLVLQRVAPQVGLAGMVTTVLGPATAADVEPLTGIASKLAECKTANQLSQYGIAPASARTYAEVIGDPAQLGRDHRERTASRRHLYPGGRGGRCARLPAGPHRVDSAAGERRAVRQLPARQPREPAASARRVDRVSAVPRLVRSDRRRRPCGLSVE